VFPVAGGHDNNENKTSKITMNTNAQKLHLHGKFMPINLTFHGSGCNKSYIGWLSVCAGVICMCWSYRVLPAFLGVVRVAN
jgi:hypothetical protein